MLSPKFYTGIFLFGLLACRPTTITTKPDPPLQNVDTSSVNLSPDPFSSLIDIHTSMGVLKAELFFHTPTHRENILRLAKENFYDSTLFHRVIKGFMLQAGDPESRNAPTNKRLGGGGAGYELDKEFNTTFFHVKGALAAARTSDEVNPDKKSSGCQFYIVQGRPVEVEQLEKNERRYGFSYSPEQKNYYAVYGGAPQLDMEYTVFGRIYEGLNLLDSMANVPTDNNDRPRKDLKILSIKIVKM